MENVRNRIRLEMFKKDDTKNIIKQQSKLTSNGTHKLLKIVIVIHSNKTKFLWINQFT